MKISIDQLSSQARVWIYQADRFLTDDEMSMVLGRVDQFLEQWGSHGEPVKGAFEIRFGLFLILGAEQPVNGPVSGCSIDSSVAVIRELENSLGIGLMERKIVAWRKGQEILLDPMHEFWAKRKAGIVNDDTVVFNNLVKDIGEFHTSWEVSFKESWHASMW